MRPLSGDLVRVHESSDFMGVGAVVYLYDSSIDSEIYYIVLNIIDDEGLIEDEVEVWKCEKLKQVPMELRGR